MAAAFVEQAQGVSQMLQDIGADDVIEVPLNVANAAIQIGSGNLDGCGMGSAGPIEAMHGEAALGQDLGKVARGAPYIEDPPAFSSFRKLRQQNGVATVPAWFELVALG